MEELVFGRRYRATEKIGTGGMADVYKAVDEVLGPDRRRQGDASRATRPIPSFAARFRQEAQAAANLVSPNIVNMYDWGADGDTYYIVMEYVRGSDLKSIIQQKGALASAKVADIGAQVCSALSVAHGYDIIHRDIKPHNIMVQPDGSVKVMDFGIARAGNIDDDADRLGARHGALRLARAGAGQGAARPRATCTRSASCSTRRPPATCPFDADTPVAVALKQVNEQPQPPSAVNPNVDPGLEAIIVKAMQKNPAQRYTSADEMRRDLQAVAQGRPPAAAVAAVSAAGVGAAAAVGPADHTAVLPTVGGATTGAGAQGRRQAPTPKKRPVWPWVLVVVALVVAGLGIALAANLNPFAAKMVNVPDLATMSPSVATAKLQSLKLGVGQPSQQTFSDSVAKGNVVSTNPPAGTSVAEGSSVILIVSKGPELFPVPDVVGKSDTEAAQTLHDRASRRCPGHRASMPSHTARSCPRSPRPVWR